MIAWGASWARIEAEIARCVVRFFFQAEDGIRDYKVTGVQTCALPIWPAGLASAVYGASEGLEVLLLETYSPGGQAGSSSRIENYLGFPTGISGNELAGQIGRASCRERV